MGRVGGKWKEELLEAIVPDAWEKQVIMRIPVVHHAEDDECAWAHDGYLSYYARDSQIDDVAVAEAWQRAMLLINYSYGSWS